MRTLRRATFAALACTWLFATVLIAQASSVQVREQEPGLLALVEAQPDIAVELAAEQIPGAQLIGAELERWRDRLVYLFDFRAPPRDGIAQVQVDAKTGQVIRIEHQDELEQPGGHVLVVATPDGLGRATIDFATAAETALAQVPSAHIVFSRLREQANRLVYEFDVEAAQRAGIVRVVVDATTGSVVSVTRSE